MSRPVLLPTRLGALALWPQRVVLVVPLDAEARPDGVASRCCVVVESRWRVGCPPHQAQVLHSEQFVVDLSSEAAISLLWPAAVRP